jgi:hypothetical protein
LEVAVRAIESNVVGEGLAAHGQISTGDVLSDASQAVADSAKALSDAVRNGAGAKNLVDVAIRARRVGTLGHAQSRNAAQELAATGTIRHALTSGSHIRGMSPTATVLGIGSGVTRGGRAAGD